MFESKYYESLNLRITKNENNTATLTIYEYIYGLPYGNE